MFATQSQFPKTNQFSAEKDLAQDLGWSIGWRYYFFLTYGCCLLQVAAVGLTLPAVLAARVCVGLGEGAALPVMNNLVATNIPAKRRATALGSCFSGFHTGLSVCIFIEHRCTHFVLAEKVESLCFVLKMQKFLAAWVLSNYWTGDWP